MSENIKPGTTVQPQQTKLKVTKPHSVASNQDSEPDNRPQGNGSFKIHREERQLNSIIDPNIVSDVITLRDTYDTLPEMKLESACHGGDKSPITLTKEKDKPTTKSPKKVNPDNHEGYIYNTLPEMKLESAHHGGDKSPTTLTKEKDEATPKSPKKINPDDHESHISSKTEAKGQPMHKSKLVKTAAKGSTADIAKNSADLPKKCVVTSSDSEEEETKKLDSGDVTHDLKSSSEPQERSDAPKKPKSQNHGNLSKPNDDKLGTPV